jgi:hypothetical protein
MPVFINLQNLLSYLVWVVTWLRFVRESAEGQCYILCCRYAVVMCFRCVGCSESNVQIGVAHENERHITSLYQNVWRGWECMLLTEHRHGCEYLSISVIILVEQPDVKAQWCKCENWCQLLQDWEVDQCGIVKYGLVPLQTRLNTDPHSQGASQCVWECDD